MMQFGDAGAEQSTKYVEFASADPHTSSLSLPPMRPLPTPNVASATSSFNAEFRSDAQNDLPSHVDTSILSTPFAGGGSGRSSSVVSTGYPADKMSGERGSVPLQSSFWERVKAIGADHSPSTTEEAANRCAQYCLMLCAFERDSGSPASWVDGLLFWVCEADGLPTLRARHCQIVACRRSVEVSSIVSSSAPSSSCHPAHLSRNSAGDPRRAEGQDGRRFRGGSVFFE